MDTVEFTPYRPNRRISAFVGAAAGLLIGICGTAVVTGSTTADAADRQAPRSAAPAGAVAAKTAATQQRLRAADCRYLADVRRVRHGKLPWSADAASEWLSQSRAGSHR